MYPHLSFKAFEDLFVLHGTDSACVFFPQFQYENRHKLSNGQNDVFLTLHALKGANFTSLRHHVHAERSTAWMWIRHEEHSVLKSDRRARSLLCPSPRHKVNAYAFDWIWTEISQFYFDENEGRFRGVRGVISDARKERPLWRPLD